MKYILILLLFTVSFIACHRKTVVSMEPALQKQGAPQNTMGMEAPREPASEEEKMMMGKAVYANRCGRCHALKNTKAFTAKDWEVILPLMIPRARLNESEAQQVRAYVMANTKK